MLEDEEFEEGELEDEEIPEEIDGLEENLDGLTSPGIVAEDATGEFQVGTDATQDVDLSELTQEEGEEEDEIQFDEIEEKPAPEQVMAPEESLELEEDEEEEDEEEEELSKGQQILAKISEQLPFLAKLIKPKEAKAEKAPKEKTQLPKNIRDPENEEEELPKSKFELFIEEKVPALAPLMAKLNKKKSSEADLNEDEEEDATPKRKIKVIHILIVAGLAVFALYEGDETADAPAPVVKIKPKYKKTPKKQPTQPEQPAVADKKSEPVEAKVEPKADDAVVAQPGDTTETEVIKDKEFAPTEPVITDTPTDTPTDATGDKTDTDSTTAAQDVQDELDDLFEDDTIAKVKAGETDSEETEEPETEEPEADTTTTVVEDTSDQVIEPETEPEVVADEKPEVDATASSEVSDELKLDDNIIDEVAQGGGGEEITEAILKQLEMTAKKRRDETVGEQAVEPTDAPNYLEMGAGLVYNCAGRHWACVSSTAFKTCGQNYAWNVKEGNALECYPSELYSNNMDCASMQQYKIDMAAETKFCE